MTNKKQTTKTPDENKDHGDETITKRIAAIEVHNQLLKPYRFGMGAAVASLILPMTWLIYTPLGMGATMGAFGISIYMTYRWKQTRSTTPEHAPTKSLT